MAVQSNQSASFGFRTASPSQKLSSKHVAHISLATKLKHSSIASISCSTWNPGQITTRHSGKKPGIFASAPSNLTFYHEPPESESPPLGKKKMRVLVKPLEKPKVVLKFVWMQKDIGVALDHKIPGFGTIPLSPYYFWPRKDAWEELKALLESKPWISELHRVFLLNQATDIINLWQSSGGDLC
ncbi:Ribosomal protein PSRP-3/Ycf65 [Arabidopsis suecica]|uniref:Ribosomal protein PSRP-3/Ycf65 n=1 Tax=Arabidopsis suecica TaxID=45249 RepID=A0A8T1Z8S3_ARASU|nr:Ribosomal protein PSRP-3/Ycf65 [Arabidopsis suecica]